MKITIRFFYIFLLIGLLSCGSQSEQNNGSNSDILLPTVTGSSGSVLIVTTPSKWNGMVGDSLRSVLRAEMPGVPQQEALFELIFIRRSRFDKLVNTHRNIILIKISDEAEKAGFTIRKNVWAKPQIVVDLVAPNDSMAVQVLKRNKNALVEKILSIERQRLINGYRKYAAREVSKKIAKQHKVKLTFPKGFKLDKSSDNFAWIAQERPKMSLGVLLYHYNYTDTNTFTKTYLLNKRDSILKEHVPGPSEGSYMTTERRYEPVFEEIALNGKYMVKMRGLWKVENDFMGGPFVSLTTVDKQRNRIVTVEGYVYAPHKDKRNLIRQVEAIIYTLKIQK